MRTERMSRPSLNLSQGGLRSARRKRTGRDARRGRAGGRREAADGRRGDKVVAWLEVADDVANGGCGRAAVPGQLNDASRPLVQVADVRLHALAGARDLVLERRVGRVPDVQAGVDRVAG